VIDSSTGAFYGTTAGGGANYNGVVFQILPPTATSPKYAYSVIYDVPAGFMWDGYVTASNGTVYVTSYQGGTGCASPGCGMVFSLTPPKSGTGAWTATTLHSFTGGSDGASPFSPVVIDSQGVLYGATEAGGEGCGRSNGCGAIFALSPPATSGQPWEFSSIYHFAGGKGGQSPFELTLDGKGNLYGIALLNGANFNYLFYKLTPPPGAGEWPETDIYRFYPGSKDCAAYGLTFDAKGAIYSTANGNCDYAFQLAPSPSNPNTWSKTVMHSFTASKSADGVDITGPLTVDSVGNVYGATVLGGSGGGKGYGTVFVLEPRPGVPGRWNLEQLFAFTGESTGFEPNGGLVLDSTGAIFGTTENGGGGGGGGVVCRLAP
jgi:hypothetical protein